MAGKPDAHEAPQNIAPNFEQSLTQLEALVSQLESGDLALDQALARFEQGVRLTRECQSALSAAQQKVQLLLQRGQDLSMEDFAPPTGAEPGPVE
jgi:exodeoxyribonuclease VII small subunit